MRRLIIRFGFLWLLLGLVTAVFIAFYCGTNIRPVYFQRDLRTSFDIEDDACQPVAVWRTAGAIRVMVATRSVGEMTQEEREHWRALWMVVPHFRAHKSRSEMLLPHWSITRSNSAISTLPDADVVLEDARGWPLACLKSYTFVSKGVVIDVAGGIRLLDVQRPVHRWLDLRILALRPIFGNLCINTILFGSVWCVLILITRRIKWVFKQIRRRHRSMNDRCEQCNYDLRSSSGMCPECGHTRHSST